MSIEYFVEGKVITQTEGDNISLSKEDISHNSTQLVNQQGTDTGVSYNSPKEIHTNDKPINTIDVSLNLFFDGTQNNKTNTEARSPDSVNHENYKKIGNKNDDSYENDYTNVARGFDAIDPSMEFQETWYIEGIGTEDLRSDTLLPGVSFGMGETGVVGKVTKGCIEGAAALQKYKRKKINILKVNVYGFSRGAAAARHFVHVATSPAKKRGGFDEAVNTMLNTEFEYILAPFTNYKNGEKKVKRNHPLVMNYGYFGACLVYNELEINSIVFNFAGLYDTVASYGPNHRGKKVGNINVVDDDTKDLGLNSIGNGRVYFALHLASDDEYRDNFDLTNINSCGLYGLELTLPGVHSDIGGSYLDGAKKISVLYCKPYETPNSWAFEGEKIQIESEKFKEILIKEGWYSEDQLEIKKFWQSDVENKSILDKALVGMYLKGLVGTKLSVRNTYDKIPLNIMFHYSKQFGVKYDEMIVGDLHEI